NRGKKALAEAERELISFGFKKEQLTQKLVVRQFGKIMDIIQEAEKGLYDAVLLGRRGLSLFDELFDQSVTKEILDHAITVPIWICRKPNNHNDIAVCFDGSYPSIRCLEHIMFMFKHEERHNIVALIVSDQEAEVQELTSKIEDLLGATAFNKDRIHTKILKGRPAPSILKEIRDNPYGMVACGRSGKGRGLLGKIFMGSVSYELYKSLRDITLCISR
ncbi:MAG: universal stress protein, partial [Desulfatiglandales bacterium]